MSFLAIPEMAAEGIGVAERAVATTEEVVSSTGRLAQEAMSASAAISASETARPHIGVDIDIRGAEKVVHDLTRISKRLENLTPVMHKQITVLERQEATKFAGKYVDTGALRASLVSSEAPGAVREITPHGLRFGTSIWYGKFQVENPGPVTELGGLVRKGHESAIMHKLTPADRERVARESGAYIMHGRL